MIAHDQPIKDEFGTINPDVRSPSLLKSLSLMIKADDDVEETNEAINPKVSEPEDVSENVDHTDENAGHELATNDEASANEEPPASPDENGEPQPNGGVEGEKKENEEIVLPSDDSANTDESVKTPRQMKIKVPAVWTPSNKRAHAALIYLYFRHVRTDLNQMVGDWSFPKLFVTDYRNIPAARSDSREAPCRDEYIIISFILVSCRPHNLFQLIRCSFRFVQTKGPHGYY